jgi:chromosome partitioning protein
LKKCQEYVDEKKLENIPILPRSYKVANRMKDLNKEVDKALNEREFVWNYPGLENLNSYFGSLLS